MSAWALVSDSWLGGQLRRDVYHVSESAEGQDLQDLKKDLQSLVKGKRVFVYVKLPVASIQEVGCFEEMGFRLVDTQVLLGKSVESLKGEEVEIREARSEDERAVREVAGKAFSWSRFHVDPQFSRDEADRIKSAWAGNFFLGTRGDRMIVGEKDGKVMGFLQVLLPSGKNKAVIDLIGVNPAVRGGGIGCRMARYLEKTSGVREIEVGTQIANTASLRFYQKLGFGLRDFNYILHFHRL